MVTEAVLNLLGGVGLFLFGMHTMTAALRELAGTRMRALLARFTRTPLSGALTGAATTAVIQSSSATMVMTVGFVGAGLLSFRQALGILYGASVGTTFTGWLLLVLGFKLPLGTLALPLVFMASLAALLGRPVMARAGRGVAGFALVFIGLDLMQLAMAGAQGHVTPADFPEATLAGRIALIGIGVAITMVTQSSSAGVAAALVLLAGQAVTFEQAAAMVIGMHIGTTFTAFLAAIGGTRAVQQTAVANVVYHLAGAGVALPLIDVVGALLPPGGAVGDAQLALVMFHTGFNLAAAAVALPLTGALAEAIARLMPEAADTTPAARLDPRLLDDPGAALDVAGAVLNETTQEVFTALAGALHEGAPPAPLVAATARAQGDLGTVQEFMARIQIPEGREAQIERLAGQLHQLDHLRRLTTRCAEAARLRMVLRERRLARAVTLLRGCLLRHGTHGGAHPPGARLARLEARLARQEARARHSTLRHPPYRMGLTVAEVVQLTDALRWMRRTTNHAQRIVHYSALTARGPADPSPDPAPDPRPDPRQDPQAAPAP
ncbi:Na/Pi cotransporter family protein [Rhodobaculum claviforme]|nr:Na/Pi symporter [Rhodobaculum claviforme]